jgi:putative Ig domain-containing protein
MVRNPHLLVATAVFILALACTVAAQKEPPPQAEPSPPLVVPDQNLPSLNVGLDIRIPLRASGGVQPYQWLLTGGQLPPGLDLDPSGFLFGRPSKPGTYEFTLTVTDSARPAHSVTKNFKSEVAAALLLEWLNPPVVQGDQITGSVQVSNGTKEDDFDLTVIVVAVNEIGRATALGYQHTTLKPGVTSFAIQFGSTLPVGSYVVHADAIAEIPAKNTILRQHLQAPELSIAPTP